MSDTDTQTTAVPEISVVVASKVGAPFIDMCLDSLKDESEALGAEVLVVLADEADYKDRLAAKYPWVTIVPSGDQTKVPAMRGVGFDAARGEFIAVIEEHCAAGKDWLATGMAELKNSDAVSVGGPLYDADYDNTPDWVVYFLEYNGAIPPFQNGPTDNLNDANIMYRRSILEKHRPLLDDGYWPMNLHPTVMAEGHKLLAKNEMVVEHRGPFPFGYYLGQRFLFSKAFAGVRAKSQSLPHRLFYILAAPIVPFLLLARIAMTVFKKKCRIGKFIQALPRLIVALFVMVAGEWLGYVFGPGDALSKVE